jgi:RNA polymerase sigma factor (sigma-70 family)
MIFVRFDPNRRFIERDRVLPVRCRTALGFWRRGFMSLIEPSERATRHPPAPAESSDAELLARFNAGARDAFEQLVARHLNWVYSCARQQVNDSHRADDVTQTVFLILARKARSLQGEVRLGPWLFKVTRYTCLQVLRAERRRGYHERKASAMVERAAETGNDGVSDQPNPLIQEMIARLNLSEREALLLRFYEGKSFPAVGAALGISEEAARKRVGRAVQSLRERLHRRGMTVAPSAVAGLLAAHATHSAPLQAAQVAASAMSQAPAHAPLADAVIRAMAMGTVKAVAVVVGALTLIVAGACGVEAYIHAGPPPVRVTPSVEQAVVKVSPGKPWAAERAATTANPALMPGWPLALPGSITAAVSVADLDGSGRLAIIVPCESLPGVSLVHSAPAPSVLLFAFYADGTPVPGWPAELVNPQLRARRDGSYLPSWHSSPSVCSDGAGGSKVVITTPYFLGLRVIDRNGNATTMHGGSQWASTPLVDMDGDGVADIVTGAALTNIKGGTIKNWPPTHPLATVSGYAPCIGDANGDGKPEVFHLFVDKNSYKQSQGDVVGYDATGHELPNWRHAIHWPTLVGFAPVMGDVSGDDKMEIIAGATDLYVWRADGTAAPGTHRVGKIDGVLKESIWTGDCSPTLADLDGDGKAEIIVYDRRSMDLCAFHGDGTYLNDSPNGAIAQIPASDLTQNSVDWTQRIAGSGVSVADLGGDGIIDLFIGTYWIKWDPRTRTSTIKPMIVDATVTNCTQATICDIDGDGKAEVIFGLIDGRVFVYRTEMAYRPELVQWATANGNFQHTGVWKRPEKR